MGRPYINLVGQRFGMLTAIRLIGRTKENRTIWECRCDCGKTVQRTNGHLSACQRRNSRSSCGCGPKGTRPTHGMTRTSEYRTWLGMRDRCYNKVHHKYHLYGKLGVKVFKGWRNDFKAFIEYVGPKPTPKHTLDRYPDPSGNYEPGNVRWATPTQQRHNRRNALVRRKKPD